KRKIQRAGDIGCRWGGEEFVFLIREQIKEDETVAGAGRRRANQIGSIASFADNLRRSIEQTPITLPPSATPEERVITLSVTVSIGVLAWIGSPREYGDATRDLEEKLKEVDRNLYLAKAQGRNRVVITEA